MADYTSAYTGAQIDAAIAKVGGIAAGAEVNVQPDWNQATDTADDYIKNKPSIPSLVTNTGTIAASASWSGPDAQSYYTYAVTATGVASTDNVDIACVKSVSDSAAAALIQTAWNLMDNVVPATNTLTFYAKTRPATAIPIVWRVVR